MHNHIDKFHYSSTSFVAIILAFLIVIMNHHAAMAASLTDVYTYPSNNITLATAFYTVEFTTATTGIIKTIEIGFQVNTNLNSSRLIEASGIDRGSLSFNISPPRAYIIYTISNPVTVAAGTTIRLEFGNIMNPYFDAPGFVTSITTKDAAGNTIDGPTNSAPFPIISRSPSESFAVHFVPGPVVECFRDSPAPPTPCYSIAKCPPGDAIIWGSLLRFDKRPIPPDSSWPNPRSEPELSNGRITGWIVGYQSTGAGHLPERGNATLQSRALCLDHSVSE